MTPAVSPDLLNHLLRAADAAAQAALLESAGLFDAPGLAQLVAHAATAVSAQPDQARQLAAIAATLSGPAAALEVAPRAAYIQAQTFAIAGDYAAAQILIETARAGYLALERPTDALRTQIGLMNILGEQGQYPAALAAGQQILDAVAQNGLPAGDAALLAALAAQNMGVCHRRMGQYDAALAACAAAERQYRQLEMLPAVGQLRINRGLILVDAGRPREALPELETAVALFATTGQPRMQAKALNNLGLALQLLGQHSRSLDALEQARRLFETLPETDGERHILLLDTADVYLSLNLYPEAVATYRQALPLLQAAGMAHDLARARWGLGAALAAQGRLDEADEMLQAAAALLAQAGNAPLQAGVLLEQAALQQARGQRGAALAHARHALDLVTGGVWPVQRVYAQLRLADLLLPDAPLAELILRDALRRAEPLALPHLRYRLQQRLGHVYLLQGRPAEALPLLETAVATIEQLRGQLNQEALRTSFLRDKIAAYEDLVQLYLNQDDAQGVRLAFAVAEQAKSRALVDLLSGLAQTRLESGAAPDVAARLAQLQADLHALYNEAFNGGSGGERRTELADLTARVSRLENEISQLRLRAVAAAAGADPLAEPLPPESIGRRMPDDVALIAYHIVGDEIMAFVQHAGRLQVVRRLGTPAAVRQQADRLANQWERFRAGRAFVSRHMQQLTQSANRVLQALHALLLAPLRPLLPPGARLVVIPHGLLHQIPFHALYDGAAYLLQQHEVTVAPSATVYALCQERQAPPDGAALVLGVPDASIPHVAAEAAAVAGRLPDAAVYLDEAATLARFHAAAERPRLLHLACHGLFRGDNPMFSALKLHDGWLTAGDVLRHDLAGALVTLSACESGRSQVLAGDELVGLARAFLGAGAASLVVSLWLVEDETTAALMADWYARMPAQRPGAALREAQLALLARHPHPYYWAPFVLMGRP